MALRLLLAVALVATQRFSAPVDGQVYATPVVADGVLLVATETNWIYGLDPSSGAVRWSRNVGAPWRGDDIGCHDLEPTVGITSTPAVDAATGTAYFTSKTDDGTWRLHAVDVQTGGERAGFPVTIAGHAANVPELGFDPSQQLQRPALLLSNGVVYAAFGGLCDTIPYQGWVAAVSTGGELRTLWVDTNGEAGAGIWQGGSPLLSDGPGQLVLATGNGPVPPPAPGTSPPDDLGQSVVRLSAQPDGSLRATDFFSPADADALNAGDRDLGSSGPTALPFGAHLAVQGGKDPLLYVLDLDALGGRAQGPGGGDAVVDEIPLDGGVFGHAAAWPGDGGWAYVATTSSVLDALPYRSGRLTVAARATVDGWFLSSPVVSDSLVWVVARMRAGGGALLAYDPTTLRLRYSAPIASPTKLSEPGADGGSIYVGTSDGHVLAFGTAPVVFRGSAGDPRDGGGRMIAF